MVWILIWPNDDGDKSKNNYILSIERKMGQL